MTASQRYMTARQRSTANYSATALNGRYSATALNGCYSATALNGRYSASVDSVSAYSVQRYKATAPNTAPVGEGKGVFT